MFRINLDISDVVKLTEALVPRATEALTKAAADLTAQIHVHIIERVNDQLHSTRDTYVKALSFLQINAFTWVVNLDASALWIEDGRPPGEMIDDLLRSPKAKTAADGSRYLVVPFQHNKAPTRLPIAQHSLQDTVKAELKRRKIPYGKIERNVDGSPRLGLLHKLDITDKPLKTHEGAAQGWGKIGDVRQGRTGIPFLQGIRIYQRQVEGRTQRGIMTFRVVSDKQKGTGSWFHPGLEPKHFFEEAFLWATREWETKIKQQVLREIVGG